MWMIAIYRRLTGQVSRLGLRAGGHLVVSIHSSNEPDKLSQRPHHDDSNINIIIITSAKEKM